MVSNRVIQEKLALFCGDGVVPDLNVFAFEKEQHLSNELCRIISGAMKNAFPRTFEFLSEDVWDCIISDLYNEHCPKNHHLFSLPYDFYLFVREKNYEQKFYVPFLNDLMYYEWIILDVKTSMNIRNACFSLKGDVLHDYLFLNPNHHLIQLNFPVHRFSPLESVIHQDTYYVYVYRHPTTGKVYSIDLTEIQAFIIERIDSTSLQTADVLYEIKDIFREFDLELESDAINFFLNYMIDTKAALGFVDQASIPRTFWDYSDE